MAFDATPGGDPRGPWCKACKQPIEDGQASAQVHFEHDEHQLNGLYHKPCSKPLVQLARVLNVLRGL